MGSKIQSVEVKRVEQPAVEALALGRTIPGRCGTVATVTFTDGSRLVADRLDGEEAWQVNGAWRPGRSFPEFWNGELARCTMPVRPTEQVAAALAEAVR